MRKLHWWVLCMGAIALLGLAAAHRTPAAADDKDTPAISEKALDALIYKSLRHSVNHGVDLYDERDYIGCYRVYEGALMTVRPMLDYRAPLQKAIDLSMAKARTTPSVVDRCFVLRETLDLIRSEVNPKKKEKDKDDKAKKDKDDKSDGDKDGKDKDAKKDRDVKKEDGVKDKDSKKDTDSKKDDSFKDKDGKKDSDSKKDEAAKDKDRKKDSDNKKDSETKDKTDKDKGDS